MDMLNWGAALVFDCECWLDWMDWMDWMDC